MNRLKELRQDKNLTLKELADQLNKKYKSSYSDGQLSNYENEKREPRNMGFWDKIGDFFDVSPFYAAGLIGINEQEAKDIIDEIQEDEIKNYRNELFKLLYDKPVKKEITNEVLSEIDLTTLIKTSAKPFIKKIIDEKLKIKQEMQNYLPKDDTRATQFAHDKLWNVIKDIDNYFLNDNQKSKQSSDYLSDDQIDPLLTNERYHAIRVAFEDLSTQLNELL